MVQPGIGSAPVPQKTDPALRNDRPNLPGRRTNTVRSRTISSRENFSRNNKSSCVGTEVLEEIAKTVEREQALGGDLMEAESNDTEQDREHYKASKLDGLAANDVDRRDRDPISRDEAGNGQDEIADTIVIQSIVGQQDMLGNLTSYRSWLLRSSRWH
jgi:hypothetical protein